jgi:phage-related protein
MYLSICFSLAHHYVSLIEGLFIDKLFIYKIDNGMKVKIQLYCMPLP